MRISRKPLGVMYAPSERKILNKTSSYNSGCLAVINWVLFNPPDALWLWYRRKRFVIAVYFQLAPQRDNREKVSALLAGHKVSDVANLVGVSRTTVYAIKKRIDDGEGVNRRAIDLGLEQRLGDKLLQNLELSLVSLWKDNCSRLLSAPNALNVVRCSLMTSSLLRLKGWLSSQIRRLGTEGTWSMRNRRNNRYLSLGEEDESARTLSNLKGNIQHPSCRSVSLHPTAQWCLWSGSRLNINWLQELQGQSSWQVGFRNQSHFQHVIRHCCAPAHISNRVQYLLQEQNFSFW